MSTTTYQVETAALAANVATLGLVSVDGLHAGYAVRVDGLGAPFDGNHSLTTVDTVTNTVTYAKNHVNVTEFDVWGILNIEVTWCDETDVETYLGLAPTEPADIGYLEFCVAAGNAWAWDRRSAAGYSDIPSHAPSEKVKLGTILKCGELYRSRGSVDGFASFQTLEGTAPISTNVEVLRLLGINRPGIA